MTRNCGFLWLVTMMRKVLSLPYSVDSLQFLTPFGREGSQLSLPFFKLTSELVELKRIWKEASLKITFSTPSMEGTTALLTSAHTKVVHCCNIFLCCLDAEIYDRNIHSRNVKIGGVCFFAYKNWRKKCVNHDKST